MLPLSLTMAAQFFDGNADPAFLPPVRNQTRWQSCVHLEWNTGHIWRTALKYCRIMASPFVAAEQAIRKKVRRLYYNSSDPDDPSGPCTDNTPLNQDSGSGAPSYGTVESGPPPSQGVLPAGKR